MRKINLIFLFFLLFSSQIGAQAPQKWTSAQIQEKIQKLNFLGSVLYVAAHPDDENTRLISYMANEVKAETAYLSLTRGDGGQNLIGTEIRELLGVLRTQELLAARRIDGGKQFFTRANDFGYSKHPDETFEIWNKEEVFSDVIMTIRKFQPDIIINRFNHENPGTTHGHHTGSAMLGLEAFHKSGDASVYPGQLRQYQTHQADRIFFNTSWWFYRGKEDKWDEIKENLYQADIGVYYPLKGKSNTEIAAESRSQHKCQGFGSAGTRGARIEYMELLGGSKPSDKKDIFSGINTTWSRLKGGEKIGILISKIESEFDPTAPYKSVDDLTNVFQAIEQLDDSVWKHRKLQECKELLLACSGLYVDVYSEDRSCTHGDEIEINLEIINRSPVDWKLEKIQSNVAGIDTSYALALENNENHQFQHRLTIPTLMDYSAAYWLREKGSLGMYEVKDRNLIGLPQTPDPILMHIDLSINGQKVSIDKPLVFKTSDPVKAEVYDPFELLPPVFVEATEETIIFRPGQRRNVRVEVLAGKDGIQGDLIPMAGEDWIIEPELVSFDLESKNEKAFFDFQLTAPDHQDVNKLAFKATVNGQTYTDKLVKIEYDHIPTQMVLQDNAINSICIDIKSVGNKVAYIMGAGDKIPEALSAIGYTVDILEEDQIRDEVLFKYPAVIVGIRAYNVMDNMKFHHKTLMNYVHKGGTVLVQYNTRHRLKSDEVGPYPIKLSRKRITDEYAPVEIIAKDHPVVNYPNKIRPADFEGWVQERGLYFPEEWDEAYVPILSSQDAGEDPLTGGLLVCEYGEGHFIYTGYSFFRELPAGVPGAYRLFANLISYGQQDRP